MITLLDAIGPAISRRLLASGGISASGRVTAALFWRTALAALALSVVGRRRRAVTVRGDSCQPR